jgi:hypothetical protein
MLDVQVHAVTTEILKIIHFLTSSRTMVTVHAFCLTSNLCILPRAFQNYYYYYYYYYYYHYYYISY